MMNSSYNNNTTTTFNKEESIALDKAKSSLLYEYDIFDIKDKERESIEFINECFKNLIEHSILSTEVEPKFNSEYELYLMLAYYYYIEDLPKHYSFTGGDELYNSMRRNYLMNIYEILNNLFEKEKIRLNGKHPIILPKVIEFEKDLELELDVKLNFI